MIVASSKGEVKALILAMWAEGLTQVDMVHALGVSQSYVWMLVRELGIQTVSGATDEGRRCELHGVLGCGDCLARRGVERRMKSQEYYIKASLVRRLAYLSVSDPERYEREKVEAIADFPDLAPACDRISEDPYGEARRFAVKELPRPIEM